MALGIHMHTDLTCAYIAACAARKNDTNTRNVFSRLYFLHKHCSCIKTVV